jgi:hypothetical protein
MYQILKEYKSDNKTHYVLMIDSNCEILEFESLKEAQDFCLILNANAVDSKYAVKQIITEHDTDHDSH